MEIFWQIAIFIFGLLVGSFLNCVIFRLEKEEGPIRGRSYCPKCNHKLNWYDLIPIFSFIILKGRCRYCKEKISLQYPMVEILTALMFLLIFNFSAIGALPAGRQGPASGWQFISALSPFYLNLISILYLFIISSLLIIIFISDLRTFIIPDKIIFPAIILALIFNCQFLFFNQFLIFIYSILSGVGASLFFLIIFLISRGKWMGFGDVKLAFFMGLFLGFPEIYIALFLSFMLGAIIGIALVLAEKKKLKSEVPFGPFLIAGTFIVFFWGSQIANWYFNLIGF